LAVFDRRVCSSALQTPGVARITLDLSPAQELRLAQVCNRVDRPPKELILAFIDLGLALYDELGQGSASAASITRILPNPET
jgi:hypothetical protein